MGIISNSVGAAAGLFASIFGAVAARKNRKKQEKIINQQLAENKEIFNRQYYQNILDRSDTANLLHNYRETLNRRNQARQNMATVTGATPEALAAQKKTDAEAYSNAVANISAQASQIKDNALQQYQSTNNYLMGQKAQIYARQAQNLSNLSAGGLNLFTGSLNNMGQSIDQYKNNRSFSNLF